MLPSEAHDPENDENMNKRQQVNGNTSLIRIRQEVEACRKNLFKETTNGVTVYTE